MEPLNVLRDELEEFNEFQFEDENSIEEAKNILEEYIETYSVPYFRFEDNLWHIDHQLVDNNRKIKFDNLFHTIQLNTDELSIKKKIIIKCWIASLMDNFSAATILSYYNGVIKFYNLTKNFTSFDIESVYPDFKELSIYAKSEICCSISNLLDYYGDYFQENSIEVTSLISHLSKTYKSTFGVRKLPKTKDILVFDNVVKDFFKRNNDITVLLKWMPIYFWWSLTIIIPMRTTEFAKLRKDCLYTKDGLFYIKITRVKANQNSSNIDMLTDISIPKALYFEMKKYLKLTRKINDGNTFICYKSILKAFKVKNANIKRFDFNSNRFNKLLSQFYKDIVFGEYKISQKKHSQSICTIEKQLLPNDTRHLAFINLKRQGYHPVEVARIGGHASLRSQEHYFSHLNNFLDLEIVALFSNKRIEDTKKSINIDFINKTVLRPPTNNYQLKLHDGYCTDQEMNCRVEDCWLCDHWRISAEEFEQKKGILEEKINQKKDEIMEVVISLEKLYANIYSKFKLTRDSSDQSIINEKTQLHKISMNLDSLILKYIDLSKLKIRGYINE